MEKAQDHTVIALERGEQFDQCELGAIQLPVAREYATVFVAVAVAEHDLLLGTTAFHHREHARQRIEPAHDRSGFAEICNGLEQGHDDEVAAGVRIERPTQQADFFLQQQHLEQIAHSLGVADDAMADDIAPEDRERFFRGFEDLEFA